MNLFRHGLSAPEIHRRNTKKEPIDGIFCSSGDNILACGMYGYNHFVESDHHALWIDVDL